MKECCTVVVLYLKDATPLESISNFKGSGGRVFSNHICYLLKNTNLIFKKKFMKNAIIVHPIP